MQHKINIKENKHVNHHTSEHPSSFSNDSSEFYSLSSFKEHTSINVSSLDNEKIVMEIKGMDPSLVNALRRIVISEVPTMAIEKCNFYQNTSIIPDEVLAHRLGLIPILADANLFNYYSEGEEYSEFNYLTFKLHVICEKEPINVYSNEIKWVPQGNQLSRIKKTGPVHDDILVAKLSPGQEIEVELICVKGIGKTHAKWAPGTSYYRLLPEITVLSTIKNEKAEKLKKTCPMGVFDIEDSGKLFVKDSKKCTMCRECIRHDEFKHDIEINKLKNQYECKHIINF